MYFSRNVFPDALEFVSVCVFQAFLSSVRRCKPFCAQVCLVGFCANGTVSPPLGFPRRKSFGATAKTAAVLVLLSLCVLWSCTYAQVFLAGRSNSQPPTAVHCQPRTADVAPGLLRLLLLPGVCVAIFVRLPEIFSVSVTGAGEQSSRI